MFRFPSFLCTIAATPIVSPVPWLQAAERPQVMVIGLAPF